MLTGSIVALVTPMTETQEVDFSALASLVDWHIAQKTQGFAVLGTTGEAATVSASERAQIVGQVVKQVAGRVPVLVGSGTNSTRTTIEMSQQAAAAKADAVLVVTPYYNKPTQEGLFQHYCAVAKAVDLPIVLYNVPSRTAVDLLPETVARLAAVPNVVAIKDATADLGRVKQLADSGLSVLSGDDASALQCVQAGGHGVISVAANIEPAVISEMISAARRGDNARATELHSSLEALYQALFIESNPIPVKFLLQQMGQIESGIRLPLTPLSHSAQVELQALLPQTDLVL